MFWCYFGTKNSYGVLFCMNCGKKLPKIEKESIKKSIQVIEKIKRRKSEIREEKEEKVYLFLGKINHKLW